MSTQVLLGPAEHHFNDQGYARTYNYLRSLPDGVVVDAIAGSPMTEYSFENANLIPIEVSSKLRYRAEAYQIVSGSIDEYDIYHYPNMNYPDWSPELLQSRRSDIPVVVGPCEAGHAVPPGSFHNHVNQMVGLDLPQRLNYGFYRAYRATESLVHPVREWLFEQTLTAADRIVAVNEATKSVYEQYVDTSIDVVPYGVNLNRIKFTERQDTKEILTVGALVERKGHEYLLRALPEIRSQVPGVSLHVVGTGPLKGELRSLACNLDVRDAVTFHEHLSLPELQERFRQAQVFVHPSTSEGYSHIRLEAMASGCPVVATRVRGAEEMIRDGVDGFLVDRKSSNSLVNATLALLKNINQAREMGRTARERVKQRHDWRDVADDYADIYRDLVS